MAFAIVSEMSILLAFVGIVFVDKTSAPVFLSSSSALFVKRPCTAMHTIFLAPNFFNCFIGSSMVCPVLMMSSTIITFFPLTFASTFVFIVVALYLFLCSIMNGSPVSWAAFDAHCDDSMSGPIKIAFILF